MHVLWDKQSFKRDLYLDILQYIRISAVLSHPEISFLYSPIYSLWPSDMSVNLNRQQPTIWKNTSQDQKLLWEPEEQRPVEYVELYVDLSLWTRIKSKKWLHNISITSFISHVPILKLADYFPIHRQWLTPIKILISIYVHSSCEIQLIIYGYSSIPPLKLGHGWVIQ